MFVASCVVPDSCHSSLYQVCSFCTAAPEPRYSSGIYSVQRLPISSHCDGKESTSCLAKQTFPSAGQSRILAFFWLDLRTLTFWVYMNYNNSK